MNTNFMDLVDLASDRLGGSVVAANDEFFAPKERLLQLHPPVWREGEYTDRGKWMDGWETRRRRDVLPGEAGFDAAHDWCVDPARRPRRHPRRRRGDDALQGQLSGVVRGRCVRHARSVHGRRLSRRAVAERRRARRASRRFAQSVSRCQRAHATHVRLRIFPDGGVARLRVYGEVMPDWDALRHQDNVDLASLVHGGHVVACSDMFFGSRNNLIMPGDARSMADGWETKRRRTPGHDWTIVRLGAPGTIARVEVDTHHFKGNAPGAVQSRGLCSSAHTGRTRLGSGRGARLARASAAYAARGRSAAHIRYGDQACRPDDSCHARAPEHLPRRRRRPAATLRPAGMTLDELNGLAPALAEAEFRRCCGSRRWARAMTGGRPFASLDAITTAGDVLWAALSPDDWLEAFAAHPEDRRAGARLGMVRLKSRRACSRRRTIVRARLAASNAVYRSRFGYIFIVCATGKSPEELLLMLDARLSNDPAAELTVAAEEQRKITGLRLAKLIGEHA